MSECDCCGYGGTDLPRYRDLMRDVLSNMVDKRTAELQERIALLDAELTRIKAIAQGQRTTLNRMDLAADAHQMVRDLHKVLLQEDKPQ